MNGYRALEIAAFLVAVIGSAFARSGRWIPAAVCAAGVAFALYVRIGIAKE